MRYRVVGAAGVNNSRLWGLPFLRFAPRKGRLWSKPYEAKDAEASPASSGHAGPNCERPDRCQAASGKPLSAHQPLRLDGRQKQRTPKSRQRECHLVHFCCCRICNLKQTETANLSIWFHICGEGGRGRRLASSPSFSAPCPCLPALFAWRRPFWWRRCRCYLRHAARARLSGPNRTIS